MRRKNRQGFTLIELMIVVAIIGILAVLAIFGVRKYLATSKTAEATNTIGAINRLAVAAYERESAPSEIVIGTSKSSAHNLCTKSAPVPAAPPANNKYTADPAPGKDYHVGTQADGWVCLKFEMSEPQYYSYDYNNAAATCAALTGPKGLPAALGGSQGDWTTCANGDLNGDKVVSKFGAGGSVVAGQAVTATEIQEEDPEE